MVGNDLITKGTKVSSWQRLCHAVGFLSTGFGPDKLELLVATTVVVAEEVVAYADVASVLGGGVVVCEVDAGLVVFVHEDRSADKLAGNILNQIDDP